MALRLVPACSGLETMNLAQSIVLRNLKLSLHKPNQTSATASYFALNTVISEGR